MNVNDVRDVLEEMVAAQGLEVERLVREWGEGKKRDLGELEVGIREWALRIGREMFGRLLRGIAAQAQPLARSCEECGGPLGSEGKRPVRIWTSMGSVRIERGYVVCERGHGGGAPLDRQLGLDGQHNSPALQRMVSLAGAVGPFEKASELLGEIGSIPMSAQKVERITEQTGAKAEQWLKHRQQEALAGLSPQEGPAPKRLYAEADGTTVPMRAEGDATAEARSVKGQRTPGKVEYKEVKLGAVFEATVDEEGRPQMGSVTYTGTFADAETCVRQVQAEAKARGSDRAGEIVLLGDGGGWLWNRLPEAFAGRKVTEILDWCHPSERLSQLAKVAFGEGTARAVAWAERQRGLLYEGRTGEVLAALQKLKPKTAEAKEYLRQSLGYFREHEGRMNYGEWRAQGYFIGSGVIESACKHIAGERFKRAGMKWSREHVPKLLALRICRASGWWGRFWDDTARGAAA